MAIIKGRFYAATAIEKREHEGKTYYSRKLILKTERYDQFTGELLNESYPSFDINKESLCRQLDSMKYGDMVEVSYIIQGIKYEKDGQTRFFNKIIGYNVDQLYDSYRKSPVSDTVPAHTTTQQQTPANMPPMPDNEDGLPL